MFSTETRLLHYYPTGTNIMNFIEMYVHAITLDPATKSPILILKEKDGQRSLPVWIGLLEATAIASRMEKLEFARPMTHDLAVNMLNSMDISMPLIEITDIRDNTFYARISLESGERKQTVDARPSDAVALALRTGARIMVNEDIVEHAPSNQDGAQLGDAVSVAPQGADRHEQWKKILEELDPDSIKYKM